MSKNAKAALYTRYPLSSVLLYNGVTALHYLLGGAGIILGYNASTPAYLFGLLYLVFAFGQMYVIMPLVVCPHCVYYRTPDARCPSANNLLSRRIAREGNPDSFSKRAEGLLCHNNLYLGSLVAPVIAILPALALNFTFPLLLIWLSVIGLLLFRFFVIFSHVACLHCRAKYDCPNAERTGVRDA